MNANHSRSSVGFFYNLTQYNNFTFFENDPINGDEIEQRDKRVPAVPISITGATTRLNIQWKPWLAFKSNRHCSSRPV